MDYLVEWADPSREGVREEITRFLALSGLELDRQAELTLTVRYGTLLAAAGSLAGNTLRSIAVAPEHQGGNCLNVLVGRLLEILDRQGRHPAFVFTKPEAALSFERLGFYRVAGTGEAVLLENSPTALDSYLKGLASSRREGAPVGAIVMNGNPFTRGHLHLVETACRECAHVHLLAVETEASSFPFADRFSLMAQGTAHLKNLTLHRGGDYIISEATFPRYFLREPGQAARAQAELDIRLFGARIGPALGVTHRYMGQEPYCETTRSYNETMQRLLPEYGITAVEIPRLEDAQGPISASRVRRALSAGDAGALAALVPESTLRFLLSPGGEAVRQALQLGDGRH